MEQSFLWYDLETFGTNPFHDRIAQFAAVRTSLDFEVMDEPTVLYCKPSPDYLPDPQACLLTGITPIQCEKKGISEYRFAREIFKIMTRPHTTVLGYNSIQFDDEFIRNLFYRNLFDPYLREYSKGNSRWDILPLVRASQDLRPGTIKWPRDSDGKPLFKLELLAQANEIGHDRAHDALSDVYATIALASRIKQENPRLFSWAFNNRNKDALRKLFDLNHRPALIYNSPLLTSLQGTTTLICPLGVPREEARQKWNTIICADLRYDPSSILDLDMEEIKKRVFLPTTMEDGEHQRYPVYRIKINKAPFVAPLKTLSDDRAAALGMDMDRCLRHREILLAHRDISTKIRQVFSDPPESSLPPDPDYQIYSGFFGDADKEQFQVIHEELNRLLECPEGDKYPRVARLMVEFRKLELKDRDRILKLTSRIFGRSFGKYMKSKTIASWKAFCKTRLISPIPDEASDIHGFEKKLSQLRGQKGLDAGNSQYEIVLEELQDYFDEIKRSVLDVS